MQAKFSLTQGSIARALVYFALPILFGNVLQSLNGSVNAVWIGKYLGEAAFAAYRLGGWRDIRLGLTEQRAAPAAGA